MPDMAVITFKRNLQEMISNRSSTSTGSCGRRQCRVVAFTDVYFGVRPLLPNLILLGWFQHCMEALFVLQMGGPKTRSAAVFDELCANIGLSLQRQSDREVSRTSNFQKELIYCFKPQGS